MTGFSGRRAYVRLVALESSSASHSCPLEPAPSALALVHSAPAPARPERIAAIDGLRGFMAWAVALYHFGLLTRAFRGGSWTSSVVTVLGLHSVEAFFMISGFCLFYLHGSMSLGLGRFYWQRFVRIAPVFYLVLALNLILGEPAGPPFGWLLFFENLTFTFGFDHPNRAMVIGGWSIGLEMMFYAAFPLLAALFRSVAALGCATVAAIAIAWSYSATALADAPDATRFNVYVEPINHAFAFLLGGLVAKLRALTERRISLGTALGIAGAGLVAWIASRPVVFDHFEVVQGLARAGYVLASVGLVALFALTHGGSAGVRGFLRGLGELSYPVYLLHPLAWVAVRAWLPEGTPAAAALAAALAMTLALALVVYRVYEVPIRRLAARPARVRLLP